MTGRIVYRSRARRGLINMMEFAVILGEARHKNVRLGLTGVLVGSGSHFLQAIEGPLDQIDRLYRRIVEDSRHVNVQLIERASPPTQAFSSASMSGAILGVHLEQQMAAITAVAHPSAEACLALLKQAQIEIDPHRFVAAGSAVIPPYGGERSSRFFAD